MKQAHGASAMAQLSLAVADSASAPRLGADVLLETKLHAPGPRKEWIERRELIDYLAGSASAKLVLVAGPAGFGKTTLVAEWRSSAIETRRFAWISLDRGDDGSWSVRR